MTNENGEFLDDGVDYKGKVVALDLEFLFNMFMRDGSEINLRVIRGIPVGANALGAGISGGSLIVVFDREVPEEIWFQDIQEPKKEINPQLN